MAISRSAVALLAASTSVAAVARSGQRSPESSLHPDRDAARDSFQTFIAEHDRSYKEGTEEYAKRFALFQERVEAVRVQNRESTRSWSAKLNKFADWTSGELSALRGYRHGARVQGEAPRRASLMSTGVRTADPSKLPTDWSWQFLQAMRNVQNQGACGSCWAVASSTVLRAHAELYQTDRTFSVQQIIECTPNPKHCGGTGGCEGATAELAMDYVAKAGLLTEDQHKYHASDAACPADMQPPKQNLRGLLQEAASLTEVSVKGGGGASFGMTGWRKLPENQLEPLMEAVVQNGPVVVSVAAADVWAMYASGIMSACEKDAVINHAVALTGYGVDGEYEYWQIQNSWGPDWGEKGFARLPRLHKKEESQYCGVDKSPDQGTGCEGGPKEVRVCGSCGILYDSVVPVFQLSETGWMNKNRNASATAGSI